MSDIFMPRVLVQTAVYWAPLGQNAGGVDQYDQPIELDPSGPNHGVRWEEKTEVFLNNQNEEQVSKAIVYVGIDLEEKGVLWYGTLATITDLANPFKNPKAWMIHRLDKIPSRKANKFVRKAYL